MDASELARNIGIKISYCFALHKRLTAQCFYGTNADMRKTVRTICIVAIFTLVVYAPLATFGAAGDVVINEIAWAGTAASPSDEWIELYNNTHNAVDLAGWTLLLLKPATTTPSKVIVLSGSIPAAGFYLIERTDENTTNIQADLISAFGTGLVDSGMILQLARNEVLVDRTPELCDNKWCAGFNNPKMSMERIRPDADGVHAANWAVNNGVTMNGKDAAGNAISGTPKQKNSVYNNPSPSSLSESSSSLVLPSSSVSSSLSPSPSHPIYPALTVDAGSDKTVLVGSLVSFIGSAFGINNAPLFDGRFLWNFGDGTLKESKTWEQVYYFPGTYTAALTVSSGPYSGFDTVEITAIVPALTIKNMQTGEDGFVVIANGSEVKLDLGGIMVRDSADAQFLIPKNTFILAGGEVTFPNRVSGVWKSGGTVALYDAAGRPLRKQPPTANEQPQTAIIQTDANSDMARTDADSKNAAKKDSLSEGDGSLSIESKISAVESAEQETAIVSQASPDSGFGISKTTLFFMASLGIALLVSVGFFLMRGIWQ